MKKVMFWSLEPGEDEDNVIVYRDGGLKVAAYGRPVDVVKVHAGTGGSCPLVNLGNGKTSVPHRSYVLSAAHGFYTFGLNPDLEKSGWSPQP